jgi:hypothetical protein
MPMEKQLPRIPLLACLGQVDSETNLFLAHCLNFDLMESGKTWAEAWANLKKVIKYHVEYCYFQHPDGLTKSAGPKEWDRFIKGLRDNPRDLVVESIEIDLKPPLPDIDIQIWIQGVHPNGGRAACAYSGEGTRETSVF